MIAFQRGTSRSLKKAVLDCRTGKKLSKRFTSQRGKERIFNWVLKVNALKKKLGQGPSVLEEAYLMLNQDEGLSLFLAFYSFDAIISGAVFLNFFFELFTVCE